jgi:hypothetical protein
MTDHAEPHPEMPPGTEPDTGIRYSDQPWPIVLDSDHPLAPIYIVPGLVVRPGDSILIGLPENISAQDADEILARLHAFFAIRGITGVDVTLVAGVTQIAKIEKGSDLSEPTSTWDRLQQSRPGDPIVDPHTGLTTGQELRIEARGTIESDVFHVLAQPQHIPGAGRTHPEETLSQDGSIVPGMRATHGSEAVTSDIFQRAGWAAFVVCGLALFSWLVTWLVRVIWHG